MTDNNMTYKELEILLDTFKKKIKLQKRVNRINNILSAISGSMIGSYIVNRHLIILLIGLVIAIGIIFSHIYLRKKLFNSTSI